MFKDASFRKEEVGNNYTFVVLARAPFFFALQRENANREP